jgi:uncharacterized BrkB/YihY/UPF0761 family membrane protein
MTENAVINVRDVLADAWADAKQDPLMLATALLTSAVPSLIAAYTFDMAGQIRIAGLIGVLLLLVQVITIRRALDRRGLRAVRHDPPRGYFVRAFLQNLLFGLITLIGLLVLVVPGLMVIALSAISIPILIAEDDGAVKSLRESASRVSPHIWRVLVLFLICALSFFAMIAIGAILIGAEIEETFAQLVAEEVLMWLSGVSWWFVQTSLYARLKSADR